MLMALVAAAVIVAGVLWWSADTPKTDEEKYKRWQHTSTLCGRTFWWKARLPTMVVKQLNLEDWGDKYWREHESIGEDLVDSGYLTNVTITLTSTPAGYVIRPKVAEELRKTFEGRDEWEFWAVSNAVVVQCRPEHIAFALQAVAAADATPTNLVPLVGLPPSAK